MQPENSTTPAARQEKTRLTPEQSKLVESASTAKVTGYTFTLPATALSRCYVCQAVTAEVILASGYVVNVDLELDHGDPRAVLTSPHTCPELQRCAEFRDAPTESPWDGAGQ